MVAPLIVAGVRVAAGAAARGTAGRAAAGRAAAGTTGSRAAATGPKPVRNPFPVARRGDAPVPGKQGPQKAGAWRQVKKRRALEETSRALENALERDDLTDEEREALLLEQYRLQAVAEQEEYSGESESIASGSVSSGGVGHRIGPVTMFFMLACALIADCLQFLVQFIPGVGQVIGWIIAFLAGGFFFMWFYMLGVSYFSGKKSFAKISAVLGMSVVELVPLVDALPALTVGVLAIILSSRAEDTATKTTGSHAAQKAPARVRLSPQKLVQR